LILLGEFAGMIVNAYAVLDAFLSLLRLGLGLLVLGLGAWALWFWLRRGRVTEARQTLEVRCYLLFLLAGLLLALNVVSWPVLYLLLQSYVPEFPGAMCIYGVTRIGTGSINTSRFLPPLLATVQALKPALIFLSGAWGVLYLVNRQTRTAPLTGRVLVLLLAAGLLAVADAGAETAYLAIPKKEEFLAGGCCTQAFDTAAQTGRLLPTAWLGELGDDQAARLWLAYYAVNSAMVLVLGGCGWLARGRFSGRWLGLMLLGAALSVVVNAVFLVEVAAPRLLHLPNHHCPYDLIPRAPASLVAVVLFLGGAACVGWAWVAGRLGQNPEARPVLPGMLDRLLRLAFLGYLGSLVMISVVLALA
jgi:hypothetical protein